MTPAPSKIALTVAVAAAMTSASCATKPRVDPQTTASVPTAEAVAQPQALESTAPAAGPFTLEQAVTRAVVWHPSVTETVSRLQQQGELVNEARSGYMPRVSWGIDSSYDGVGSGRYKPMLNVSGSQMIYDFGKVEGRIKVAEAGVVGRRTQILGAVDELSRQAAYAVIEIKRGSALKGVAQDQIADTKAILKLVSARTESGASTRSDQLQAESRVQAAEASLLEIEAQLNRWQSVLASLTGTAGRAGVKGPMPAWLRSACAQQQPDWGRVPAIMQAEAEQEAAKAEIGLSRAEAFPTIALEGRAGSDLTRLGSVDPEYRVGLNVTGSLYNGGESAARRSAAVHSLGASQAAVARARVDIQQSLAEAGSQISSLQKLQGSLASREKMMRETRDLYQTQYLELGTRTLLDLLNAAQELHAARFDMRNIEHDIHKLGIDCTFSSGKMRQAFSLEGKQVQGVGL